MSLPLLGRKIQHDGIDVVAEDSASQQFSLKGIDQLHECSTSPEDLLDRKLLLTGATITTDI